MPRRILFANEQIYHVFNRGVEKRDIFLSQRDYLRFVQGLYYFNDKDAVLNVFRFPDRSRESIKERKNKNRELIEILCFCLMPNHFHLMVRQKCDNGTSLFMQKLGSGYVNYFNTKHDREGVLFQGRFKAIHVQNDSYLNHLSRYIHLNPVELVQPDWKECGIKNRNEALRFLEKYRWSSFPNYSGQNNFSEVEVIDLKSVKELFGLEGYSNFVGDWLAKDLEDIEEVILE